MSHADVNLDSNIGMFHFFMMSLWLNLCHYWTVGLL